MSRMVLAVAVVCALAAWNSPASAQQPYFASGYGQSYAGHHHHHGAPPSYGSNFGFNPVINQPYPNFGGEYGYGGGFGSGFGRGGYGGGYNGTPGWGSYPGNYPLPQLPVPQPGYGQPHHHHHHHNQQPANQSHPWHPGHYLFGI